MQYVYRYVLADGNTAYVGIAKDLKRRIYQHTKDKLSELRATIQYFPVKHRTDAELIETYLIGSNKYAGAYNIAKTKKGASSILDGVHFPWLKWTGEVDDNAVSFVINDNVRYIEKVVYETKYVRQDSTEATINYYNQECIKAAKRIREEIQIEQETLVLLSTFFSIATNALPQGFTDLILNAPPEILVDDILEDIWLNNERLHLSRKLKKVMPTLRDYLYPGVREER